MTTDTTETPTMARPSRAQRKAADAQAELLLLDARAEIGRKRAECADQQQQRQEERQQRIKARKAFERGENRTRWAARVERWRRTLVLVGAIVGVNVVAVAGQVSAFHDGFGWPLAGALGAAAVVESIAIYVGWHAHIALIEGDSVVRLRAASYGIASVVGGLNYHHYAADWMPTDKAVLFGMASLLSPWLWAIHSRHLHRTQLRQAGLIDPRAPKFSALRWILHREETWQALRWAVRHSEQSPAVAILAIQSDQTLSEAVLYVDRAHVALASGRDALIGAQSAAIAATEIYAAVLESEIANVSAPSPAVTVEDAELADTSADAQPDAPGVSGAVDGEERERPDAQDNRDAEKWIRAAMRKGRTPKQADIKAKYGGSNGWAALRVKAARAELSEQGYRFLTGNVVQPPTEGAVMDGSPKGQGATDSVRGAL